MFDIPDEKIFMDSIHGYITVPRCFVNNLIDTEAFQRLRNIDQTGMRTLCPSARHDRFSHSLGVFHLGCKAVDALLENFRRDAYWNIRSDKTRDIFWAKNKVLFLIACLLHDIGHTPYSHSMENIVFQNSEELSTQKLCKRIIEEENWGEDNEHSNIDKLKPASHEQIGAMYILDHMGENIERVFDDLIEVHYPSIKSERLLYAEHYDENITIDKSELQRDIAFIARMILGFKYTGHIPEKQIRNCFIELVNGSSFDVDKLDYVIRDTKESGISNTNVDVDRLLASLSIITKTRYSGFTIGNPEGTNFVNYSNRVILRMSGTEKDCLIINGNFSGTIFLRNSCSVRIGHGSKFISLRPVEHAKISYTDNCPAVSFSAETGIVQDGEVIVARADKKMLETKNRREFDCTITDATLLDNDFEFVVNCNENYEAAMLLQVNGNCNIDISGSFKSPFPFNCFNVEMCGKMAEAVFLWNNIPDQLPNLKRYNEFSIGFHKKAINVIANVLEARNYLYLWIYAHHKVMYYANFLIPALACEALGNPHEGDFLNWHLCYTDINHLDDGYVLTSIKAYYYKHRTCKPADREYPWVQLCQELLTRKYKLSLYKSLAETDVQFNAFSDTERMQLKKHLSESCRNDWPYVGADNISAGYLKQEIIDELKALGAPNTIRDIVYVDASLKFGSINADETFIVMKDEVIPMSDIPLLSGQRANPRNTKHYFYLYFSTDSTDTGVLEMEMRELKLAVKEYMRKLCKKAV